MDSTKKPAISLSTGTLSASLCAYFMCMSTSAAYANPDRAAMQSSELNARETWRAARMEARDLRHELRQERRDTPRPVMTPGFRVLPPVDAPRLSRRDGGRNRSDRPDVFKNSRGGNTGDEHMLFPGQVSSFRTTRPHDNRAASLSVGQSTYINDNGREKDLSRGLSLDFSSTDANITVGSSLLSGETTIEVGGETKSISAGSRVTAAEYAALNQKLATGSQGLVLNSNGAASGGSLNLNLVSDDGATIRASELVVPENVSVTGDFGRTADGVQVSKDLVNFGSIAAVSTNANRNLASISARNITNEQSGSIASLSTSENPTLDLSLRAESDLNNAGSISSAGNLELSAGRSIVNHGTIDSAGNITLTNAAESVLAVNNDGGTISALNGAINVRTPDYSGNFNSTIYGGDLLSKELNLHAGQGSADVLVGQLTGTVNSSGLAAHVNANTGSLVLGNQCLTGDPTYYNTGNIIIGGNILVAEALAIISGGNITTNQANLSIVARAPSTQGFDIHIIAGANVLPGPGQINPPGGPAILPAQPPIAQNSTVPVTFSAASATGGSLDLTAATNVTIDSRSTSGNLNGGNVTIAAFADINGFRGQVLLPTNSSILTAGSGSGNNGNVSIIAGSSTATIAAGNINNMAGGGTAAGTGNLLIANAQPTTSDALPITFGTNGSITSANTIVPSTSTKGGASVSFGVLFIKRDATIRTGASISIPNLAIGNSLDVTSTAGTIFLDTNTIPFVQLTAQGSVTLNSITGTNVELTSLSSDVTANGNILSAATILAAGNINLNGAGTAVRADGQAPVILIAGQDIQAGSGGNIMSNGPSGLASNMFIAAGAAFVDNGASITITGASATGGNMFSTGTAPTIFANALVPGANGGDVTLLAFSNQPSTGTIRVAGLLRATSPSQSGGDVVILADAGTGTAIDVVGGVDATGLVPNTGTITMATTTPAAASAGSIQKSNATYSGTFTGGVLAGSNISTGTLTTFGGAVTVTAGDVINFNSGSINTSVNGAGVTGATINVFSGNAISNLAGVNASSANGNGGQVDITANSSFTLPGNFNANGGADGGQITLTVNSFTPFLVNSMISAMGNLNGGTIAIFNYGDGVNNGGITVSPITLIVDGLEDGGNILLDATSGPTHGQIIFNGSQSIAAVGNPAFDNGTITLRASRIEASGGLNLFANGGNTGSGLIEIVTTDVVTGDFQVNGSALDIETGGNIQFFLAPGRRVSTASSTGNAGGIILNSGSVITGSAHITARSTAGDGGSITITAGIGVSEFGDIDTTTNSGDSGFIDMQVAGLIAGAISTQSSGNSGYISIAANSGIIVSVGGSIGLSTIGTANSGAITLTNAGSSGFFVNGSQVLTSGNVAGDITIDTTAGGGNITFLGGTNVNAEGSGVNGNVNLSAFAISSNSNLSISTDGTGGAGTITINTNAGSGVFSVQGDLSIDANSTLNLNVGTGGIVTTPPGGGDAGDIILSGLNVNAAGVQLDARGGNLFDANGGIVSVTGTNTINIGKVFTNGFGTGSGGNISLVSGFFGLTADSLEASRGTDGGAGGIIDIDANNLTLSVPAVTTIGGSVDIANFFGGINTTGDITAATVLLTTTNSNSITIGASITGTTQVNLVSISTITQSAGTITTPQLNLTFATGPVSLTTDAGQLFSANAAGQTLNLTNANTISIGSLSIASLQLLNSAGDVTFTNAVNLSGALQATTTGNVVTQNTVTAQSISFQATNIQINDDLTNTGAGSIALTATSGDIDATGQVSTAGGGSLNISLLGTPGTATLSGNNNVDLLNGVGGGSIVFSNDINELHVGTLGGTQSLNASTTHPNGISLDQNITTTGTITLNTPRVFTQSSITAASITLQSSGNLAVDGGTGGSLTGTVPIAGLPGFPSVPAAIIFNTGIGATLTLFGDMALAGDVAMNNLGGTTTSQTASLFHGTNNVTLTTNTWTQIGGGDITGNNFILSGITIINSDGNVVISANQVFAGRSLAIVAQNDITINAGVTIDLSSTTSNGGSLTLIAGYDFTPSSGGQTAPTTLPFTLTGPSIGGGDIIAAGATIITASTAATGNGGNVRAFANGGSIDLGTIDTSSLNGDGGNITLVAPNGIDVGNITATAAVSGISGIVQISSANTTTSGTPVVQAGTITGGNFNRGTLTASPIVVNAIDTGKGEITVESNGGTIDVFGSLTTTVLTLDCSSTINLHTTDTLTTTPNLSSRATIDITASDVVTTGSPTLLLVASSGGSVEYSTVSDLNVSATGDLSIDASGPNGGGSVTLQSDGNITIGAGGITANGANGGGSSFVILAANDGTGLLTLNDTSFLTAANATGTNNGGGRIEIGSDLISFVSSATSPLVLSANGVGTGNGGFIDYAVNDPTATFVGAPPKTPKPPANFMTASAISGAAGGHGGDIDITTGGNLTVQTTAFNGAPQATSGNWDASRYSLTAGNVSGKAGNLVINGNLSAIPVGTGAGGRIDLASVNKKAFVVNSTKLPKNGIFGQLTATGNTLGILNLTNFSGGIQFASSFATLSNAVNVFANLKGSITVGTNVKIETNPLAAGSIVLNSETGSIGKKPLPVSAAFINLDSVGGSINVFNDRATLTTLSSSVVGKNFTFSTVGSLTTQVIITTSGSISVTSGGALNINGNVNAANGGVTLVNTDTATGTINIGNNRRVESSGNGGDVIIAIGAPPKKGTNPTPPNAPPANITVTPDPAGKGVAFFGPPGGVVAPTAASVEPFNKNVIFNNGSTNILTNKITLGDNSVVRADPPSRVVSSSPHSISQSVASLEAMPVSIATPVSMIGMPTSLPSEIILIANLNSINQIGTLATASLLATNSNSIAPAFASATIDDIKYDVTTSLHFNTTSDASSRQNELIVDAEFHSNLDARLSAFSSGRVAGTELSAVSSNAAGSHSLLQGNALFAPKSDTTIKTPHGNVKLAAGTIALVMQSENALAVYDLHDQRRNAVVVEAGGVKFTLSPGRHVVLSNSSLASSFDCINPIELVQYRGLKQSELRNGFKVYTSEFSIPSACYAVKPLKHLMTSPHSEAANLAKRIMKTTAVLMSISPDNGDFVQFFKPTKTAMR